MCIFRVRRDEQKRTFGVSIIGDDTKTDVIIGGVGQTTGGTVWHQMPNSSSPNNRP